jgi:autotransporter family porin
MVTNQATIAGGAGYTSSKDPSGGGSGGLVLNDGTIINNGMMLGGAGGGARESGANGGAGAYLYSGGTLSNAGNITAGNGGFEYGQYGLGGSGGAGVFLHNAVLFTTGTITGGTGGDAETREGIPGSGGAGAYINGGTLVASGTITGGQGGMGRKETGSAGDAVQFGTLASTLEITSKAVLNGDVAANTAVDDTFVLSGKASGTLSGFGTIVTGFRTLDVDPNTNWTLSGSIEGTGALSIGSDATLVINGASSIASLIFAAGGNETLRLGTPAQFTSLTSGFGAGDVIELPNLKATSLSYSNGTLTLFDRSQDVVGTLTFAGTYDQADFALKHYGDGGSEIVYAGVNAAALPPHDYLPQSVLTQHAQAALDAGLPNLRGISSIIDHTLFDILQLWHGHIAVNG